jgi:hypothetical protein
MDRILDREIQAHWKIAYEAFLGIDHKFLS